ncbi:MAG: YdcF family protein [Clostridia bacterium]|nr:YdcF family protein [Clostridia bacterium]MBR4062041.1 YdcF family protein [Clostridia bacterium]
MPAFLKKITKKQWCAIAKNAVVLLLLFALLFAITLLSLNAAIKSVTKDKILEPHTAAQLGDIDCILVLGCHVRSQYLADRLTTAFGLYDMGASPKLLMTGDHGREVYDEVNYMLDKAEEHGIERKDVFTDHAGFSTYESIYRAKEIFGAKRIIIVTQEYHLYRALYLAEKLGIEAYGVSASLHGYGSQDYQDMRESLARMKDFFYALIKPEPTFLGESIPISGDAYPSHD